MNFCRKCAEISRNKQPVARLGQSPTQSPALPPSVTGTPNQEQPQFRAWQAPSQTHAILGRGKDTGKSTAHCFWFLIWEASNEATSKEWRREEFCQRPEMEVCAYMCAGGGDGLQTHQPHGRERGLRPSKGLCLPRETVSHGDHGEHGVQAARQKEGRAD